MKMHLRRTLSLALLTFAAACGSVQDDLSRQILQPPPGWLAEPAATGLTAEPFTIDLHAEASLTGFWIPRADAAGRTVVLFHDEKTNASVMHAYYTFLHEQGFQVAVFDPRGFGRSRGTPTLQAWIHDVPELLEWLRARTDVDGERIAFFGIGWGAVTAAWAARTQAPCAAVVLENMPSPRQLVREATQDDGSMLSALSTGMLEFAGIPEDIEPVEGAPRTRVPALFVVGDHENAREKKAQLATFTAWAGEKRLWILPGTRSAPHALVTHDGEYQRQVAGFLRDALGGATGGSPVGPTASAVKTSTAPDGQAWYEVTIHGAPGGERRPVEIGAMLADGSAHFAHAWLEQGTARVRIKLPSPPAAVGAIVVATPVAEDPEQVFLRTPTALTASAAAVEPLWPRIDELRNGALSSAESVRLADELRQAEVAHPFHPRLAAELADVWALLGKALSQRPEPERRRQGSELLQRAVAAVPRHPELHVWPGASTTYGFPQQEAVELAKRLLAAPPK